MRDLLVTAIILGSIPYIMKRPWIGVLVWSWIGYMNPHRLTWGFAFDMPFAQIIALVLFVAILMSKDKKEFPPSGGMLLVWTAFIAWMALSSTFALYVGDAWTQYIKIIKIQIVTFLTILLITDQKKIDLLIWVIVGSIGFYSVKGGLFTLMTGGVSRVYGPPGGFIQENNSLALATLMVVPLIIYLFRIAEPKWLKAGLAAAVLLSLVSALGSQSRGALLSIIAVCGYFWISSKYKIATGLAIVVLAIVGFSFMPDSWHDRMETIQNYEQDGSAMGRINAWWYSFNVANDRITGAGLNSWNLGSFYKYAPEPLDVHAAHSIYFGVLADHGWPGLIMFLTILTMAWRNLSWVIRRASGTSMAYLASSMKVSLVAYMSGGAFLSLAYFDLPWHLYAISILLRHQTRDFAPEPKKHFSMVRPSSR